MQMKRWARIAVLSLGTLALVQCGEPDTTPPSERPLEPGTASSPTIAPVTLADSDLARVCRAAIADINGHDPAIMRVESNAGGTARISYARPSDDKVWTNDCRVEGGRVLWRMVDAFGPGSGTGRWRNDPEDEVITYRLEGEKVSVTTAYADGSGSTEDYAVR